MMNIKKYKYLFMIISMLFILLTGTKIHAVPNELEVNAGPVRILYDTIGHYALNYAGNTNHYDYWDTNGKNKLVNRNYKDRLDIVSENNSSAEISKLNNSSRIEKAYLIWESRSQNAWKTKIQFITPSQQIFNISSQIACKDSRTNYAGEEYVGVYTMATDVTDIVCSNYGGYGTYTVANIPVWNGAGNGVSCGGESVASWQLVIVEESPEFPLRTISLNLMSQYFYNVDYTVKVDFADASSPNGVISAQFLDGTVDLQSDYRYDGIGYQDDYNYESSGHYFRYRTPTRGLYKNGVCINDRDTGSSYGDAANAKGGIRVHLFDDYRRANNMESHSMTYLLSGKNMGMNLFLFGVSVDVYSYTVKFDGNGATGGSMEDVDCIYGRDYNLPKNKFERQYYQFAGWNTKPDGSGKSYADKGYIYNLTSTEESVTLYAQWKQVGYQITLDNQGANTAGTKKFYEWYGRGNYADSNYTQVISKITVPQKKCHFFGGYYTGKDGTDTQYIDASGNILSTGSTFTKNTVLYAKWAPAVFKIMLDNQGANTTGTAVYYEKYGVGTYTTNSCTTAISQITLPTKTHYTFEGYYTEKNGEGQIVVDKNGNILPVYTYESDITIYAYWKPVTYTITLNNQSATSTGSTAFYEVYNSYNYILSNVANSALGTSKKTFNYTGGVQTFVAPYTGTYTLDLYGASGAASSRPSHNGSPLRGRTYGTVKLTEGDILYIYCGGQGSGLTGGWNGGGNGVSGVVSDLVILGGGGATDIRLGGTGLNNRIIVAGGSGGSVQNASTSIIGGWAYKDSLLMLLNKNSEKLPHSVTRTWPVSSAYDNQFFPTQTSAATFSGGRVDWGSAKYYSNGSFGSAGKGGGGGYYGGGYVNNTEDDLYQGSLFLQYNYFMTTAGSSYVGGVSGGVITGPYSAGHGAAYITYTNYKSNQIRTNSIAIPKRTGYVFGGYYTGANGTGTCYVDANGNILSTTTTFTKNTTLYAKWTASTTTGYKIQFNGNGATSGSMALMSCSFDKAYNLSANKFARTGYKFAGWSTTPTGSVAYADKASVINLANRAGDVVVLYAKWTAANVSYKVNHYLEDIGDGWSLWDSQMKSAKADSSVSVIDLKSSKTGFSYSHAELKGIKITNAVISADGSTEINLYYTRNVYTVKLNKGTGIEAVEGAGTYKYEDMVKVQADVLKGYFWYAWSGTYYSTDKSYEFLMPAQDVELTANTSPVIYKVTLDNQNPTEFGTMEYYEKYGVGNYMDSSCVTQITDIVLPKKTGYSFKGYYTGQNGNGVQSIDASGKILASSTAFAEDTILYAYWTPVTYIVRFEGNGATGGSMEDFVCTYGVSSQLPLNEFIKTHYAFNSWNTEIDGNGISYVNGSLIENLTDIQNGVITLYAQWTPNKYTVRFDANGGMGEMEDILLTYDQPSNLPMNQFTRNNGYGDSTFLGWNIISDTREIMYRDGVEVTNMTEEDGSILILYAVWDDCPWILAEDLYYSLNEAQNGEITYDELMSRALAEDLEDGSNIIPGIDEEKGTAFTIIDYQEADFTQFKQDGSVTETYQVIDSVGNTYKKMITVYVVDTTPKEVKSEGTTRFIDEKYYGKSYENGGLEEDSIWRTDQEYIETIQKGFENEENDSPFWIFKFSYEEIKQMKLFMKTNGIGNFNNEDALQHFYDEFMVPNMVN